MARWGPFLLCPIQPKAQTTLRVPLSAASPWGHMCCVLRAQSHSSEEIGTRPCCCSGVPMPCPPSPIQQGSRCSACPRGPKEHGLESHQALGLHGPARLQLTWPCWTLVSDCAPSSAVGKAQGWTPRLLLPSPSVLTRGLSVSGLPSWAPFSHPVLHSWSPALPPPGRSRGPQAAGMEGPALAHRTAGQALTS